MQASPEQSNNQEADAQTKESAEQDQPESEAQPKEKKLKFTAKKIKK